MKKYLPYILVSVIAILVIFLFITGNDRRSRQLDERLSFSKDDKIPYGMYVAFSSLPYLFPSATIATEHSKPGAWDSTDAYAGGQALIIISPQFNAEEQEIDKIIKFVETGNDVFISTWKVSYYAEKAFKTDIYYQASAINSYFGYAQDTMTVMLRLPSEKGLLSYSYPGRRGDTWFVHLDSTTSTVLGYDAAGRPNFIHLRAGKGNLFVHLSPLAFSNYFLMHENNLSYYEQVFSYLANSTKKIVWDTYYQRKVNMEEQLPSRDKSPNLFSKFLKYRSFAAALLVLFALLLAYVLLEMRRKQRPIPVINPPKNDSLEFVKTIGRLYHDRGDHRNLAKKMAAYFLEHVRNRYKLPTNDLNDAFVDRLGFKTGVDETEIREIVNFIRFMDTVTSINERELVNFQKQLETFYKKA